MTVAPLREEEVIAAIRAIAEPRTTGRVLLGIGDDAAVWQPSRSHRSVISTDALIEGVHFSRETMALEDVGWRAMAANASDIAAMGAQPVLMTIALGVPATYSLDEITEVYRGLDACARAYGFVIAGGDLTRSSLLTLAIAVVGEVRTTRVKTRVGARPGNILAVTGPLGGSRAGLTIALGRATIAGELGAAALQAFRRPAARLPEGAWLAASAHVRAMMDCSDGLSTDLDRLCAASGVGALVDEVPVAESARAVAESLGEDPAAFALAGGEDFELLLAVSPRGFGHLAVRFARRFGRPLLRVGVVRQAKGVATMKAGREEPLARTGWDHFREPSAG